jgi:hypothetical protein
MACAEWRGYAASIVVHTVQAYAAVCAAKMVVADIDFAVSVWRQGRAGDAIDTVNDCL